MKVYFNAAKEIFKSGYKAEVFLDDNSQLLSGESTTIDEAEWTEEIFLNYKFPNIIYVQAKRGPSTKYNESIHFKNTNIGKNLNIFYDNFRKKIYIDLYDMSKPERYRVENIYSSNKINNKDISLLFKKHLEV